MFLKANLSPNILSSASDRNSCFEQSHMECPRHLHEYGQCFGRVISWCWPVLGGQVVQQDNECSGPNQACLIPLKLLQAHELKVTHTFKCFSGLGPKWLVLCRAENLD